MLPPLLLTLALSSLFFLADIRRDGYFSSTMGGERDRNTVKNLLLAENLSLDHGLRLFLAVTPGPDESPVYKLYSRFPIGGYVLIKLAMAPFDSPPAKIFAARLLMLAFFCAAAMLAYAALCRITANRWIALAATLLAFSFGKTLSYGTLVNTETMVDLFAFMLVFHGMVLYAQDGRFRQLLAKTCVALLLGWHVYGLLLAFLGVGAVVCLPGFWRRGLFPSPLANASGHGAAHPVALSLGRLLILGLVALLFGAAVLGFNFANEYAAYEGQLTWRQLPSVESAANRTGRTDVGMAGRIEGGWPTFLRDQIEAVGRMLIPRIFAPYWPSGSASVALGALAALGCLLGLVFAPRAPPLRGVQAPPEWSTSARSAKMLLGTLALSGPCWALPMAHHTVHHPFERMFYVGLPLTFFALGLLHSARFLPHLSRVAAVAAVPIFIASCFVVSQRATDKERIALQKDVLAELDEIRRETQGSSICLAEDPGIDLTTRMTCGQNRQQLAPATTACYWPLHGAQALLRLALQPCMASDESAKAPFDYFVTARPALGQDHDPMLLTPGNRFAFLYDGGAFGNVADFYTRSHRSRYAKIAASEPAARGVFDVYVDANTLVFVREPCRLEDLLATFFLHVVPENPADLGWKGQLGEFRNLDFKAYRRSDNPPLFFDGKCLVARRLPNYPIANVATGQYALGKEAWRVSFDLADERNEADAEGSLSRGDPFAVPR